MKQAIVLMAFIVMAIYLVAAVGSLGSGTMTGIDNSQIKTHAMNNLVEDPDIWYRNLETEGLVDNWSD